MVERQRELREVELDVLLREHDLHAMRYAVDILVLTVIDRTLSGLDRVLYQNEDCSAELFIISASK